MCGTPPLTRPRHRSDSAWGIQPGTGDRRQASRAHRVRFAFPGPWMPPAAAGSGKVQMPSAPPTDATGRIVVQVHFRAHVLGGSGQSTLAGWLDSSSAGIGLRCRRLSLPRTRRHRARHAIALGIDNCRYVLSPALTRDTGNDSKRLAAARVSVLGALGFSAPMNEWNTEGACTLTRCRFGFGGAGSCSRPQVDIARVRDGLRG
jgi:hypothetical protein